jgi:hypothetical protein
MVYAPSLNGIIYIGNDDKIHLYSWSSGWAHSWLPYTYGSPSIGYTNGDLAKGSIDWDDNYKRAYYAGYDGRIQMFGMAGSSWYHQWVDDYWNTDEYLTFNSTQSSATSASIKLGFDGPERSIFYVRKDNRLEYFKAENCEV